MNAILQLLLVLFFLNYTWTFKLFNIQKLSKIKNNKLEEEGINSSNALFDDVLKHVFTDYEHYIDQENNDTTLGYSTTTTSLSLTTYIAGTIPKSRATRSNIPLGSPTTVKIPKSANFDWLASKKPSDRRETMAPPTNVPPITVIEWRWPEVGIFFAFASFIVATGIARAAFHRSHFLLTHIPESCILIGLGAFVGSVLYAFGVEAPGDYTTGPVVNGYPRESTNGETPKTTSTSTSVTLPVLSPRLFFNVLIPPVILEAAYTMYDRSVLANIFPILLHSLLGKFMNAVFIGTALLIVERNGWMGSLSENGEPLVSNYSLSVPDALLYSSIASGVDSAAVLPIFEENGVDKDLFFLLLGESLMNDAITVTISEYTAKLAASSTFQHEEYGKAVLYLIAVSLGGLAFGIVGGLVSALVTRATHHCPAIEPLALLGLAYMSYISAELIQFSGHICIMGVGLLQAHYAFKNISHTSYNTVKDLSKMISATSEAIIFLFLGMVLVSKNHSWNLGFVCWTLLLCLIIRFLVVILLSGIHSLLGGNAMGFKDQIVLSYSGVRGAVCFCLAHMADPLVVAPRQMFITTLLVLIIETTFLQGGTVKFLIDLLNLKRSHWGHEKSVVAEFHDQVLDIATSGVTDIIGIPPNIFTNISKFIRHIDEKYFMKLFLRQNEHMNMSRLFNEYSKSYSLALLQQQLFLAVKDAQFDKRNSKILMVMPTVFSNLARKMGPQVLPMVYFGDSRISKTQGPRVSKRPSESSIREVEEVEDKNRRADNHSITIEDVENPPNEPAINYANEKRLSKEIEEFLNDTSPLKPITDTNKEKTKLNNTLGDDLIDKLSNDVIEKIIEQVTKDTPPATEQHINAKVISDTPSQPRNSIDSKNDKNRILEIINEEHLLSSNVNESMPVTDNKKSINKDFSQTGEIPLHVPEESNASTAPNTEIKRNDSITNIKNQSLKSIKSIKQEINETKLTKASTTAPPVELPAINLITPSPNSTQGRKFSLPFRRQSTAGRQIPIFRPSQSSVGFFNRRTSKNEDSNDDGDENPLNATAESLRRAIIDSPYNRMKYHGRHSDLQADYERLTQSVLSRHLQAIDDELHLVREVMGRCQDSIAILRLRYLSRASRRISEPSDAYKRELETSDAKFETDGNKERKQAVSAPEAPLDSIPIITARQRYSRDPINLHIPRPSIHSLSSMDASSHNPRNYRMSIASPVFYQQRNSIQSIPESVIEAPAEVISLSNHDTSGPSYLNLGDTEFWNFRFSPLPNVGGRISNHTIESNASSRSTNNNSNPQVSRSYRFSSVKNKKRAGTPYPNSRTRSRSSLGIVPSNPQGPRAIFKRRSQEKTVEKPRWR